MTALLQDESACFHRVADYTYDWESWHDPDGKLLWVNPAVERSTGASVEECLAMEGYPLPLVVEEDRETVARALESARRERGVGEVEFRCRHRDGRLRWMALAWQGMDDGDGRFLGVRTSVRDVTERQALREQLRKHADHLEQLVEERTARLRQLEERQREMEKLAALGQLAAGVAHEINNPLAGIRNAFELLRSEVASDHPRYELIGLIDREIERIGKITFQLFQLNRDRPPKSTEFCLRQSLEEVAFLLETTARRRGVQLTVDSAGERMPVLLPEGEVRQILLNLIRNGIEATPEGGRVTVRLRQEAGGVVVAIRDEGPGVPEHLRSRIFEPFYTTRTGDAEPGMGLGLSVSRSLIEAMGGRIELENNQDGGATFAAVFPRRVENTVEESE